MIIEAMPNIKIDPEGCPVECDDKDCPTWRKLAEAAQRAIANELDHTNWGADEINYSVHIVAHAEYGVLFVMNAKVDFYELMEGELTGEMVAESFNDKGWFQVGNIVGYQSEDMALVFEERVKPASPSDPDDDDPGEASIPEAA